MEMGLAFLSGVVTAGFFVAGLFFLRFWRRTQDKLFAAFAGAFVLLGINQALSYLVDYGWEEAGWVWPLRIAAFLLIIAAIVGKNLNAKR